eukprot:TRINITY_DN10312_c0_g2_i1.p1 TRINITY_DN10312_c0_g2~~TRINITY_DN10312_c0_g2_i1.p1  ORF type:complete len:281 (-),score=63.74 TRINITY_DN10312_c0_g2_i1:113-922(-)
MTEKSVNQTKRKEWNLDEYRRKAIEREYKELDEKNPGRSSIPLRREYLKAREGELDLTRNIGKTKVVSGNTPLNKQGGFYCPDCDCVIKDSANYLDHINGKKHQRNLGMSLRTKRATLEDVRNRLKSNKRKHEELKSYDFDERMKELAEEEEKKKRQRKERKKEKKRNGSSSSSKKKTTETVELSKETKHEDRGTHTDDKIIRDENTKNSNSDSGRCEESSEGENKRSRKIKDSDEWSNNPTETADEDHFSELLAMGLPVGFGSSKKQN